MRINILNHYIKLIGNFNNYYHFYGDFIDHIYIFFSYSDIGFATVSTGAKQNIHIEQIIKIPKSNQILFISITVSLLISIITIITFEYMVHFQNLSACHPPQKLLKGMYITKNNVTNNHSPDIPAIIAATIIFTNTS